MGWASLGLRDNDLELPFVNRRLVELDTVPPVLYPITNLLAATLWHTHSKRHTAKQLRSVQVQAGARLLVDESVPRPCAPADGMTSTSRNDEMATGG